MSITAGEVPNILKKYEPTNPNALVIDFERSEGSWVVDHATGVKYLDCDGFGGVLPLGFGHPAYKIRNEVWEPVPVYKLPHHLAYCCQYATFMDKFAEILPDNLQHFSIYDNEEAAVENALKIAFDWKGEPSRCIYFNEGFHGRTGFALSVSDIKLAKDKNYLRFPSSLSDNPKVSFPMVAGQEQREQKCLDFINEAIKLHPTAGIIIEPIQNAGGNNMFREEFLKALRKLADENNVLLIFDETHTGFGASGQWWCFQAYGVEPDMFIFGGKAQVAGVAWNKKINESISEIDNGWGGSLYDMDRCLHIIQAIKKEGLIENTKKVGGYLIAKLRSLQAVSALVSNSRGIGTLVAFDMPNPVLREHCLVKLRKNVLIAGSGERSIAFRPALTFSREDVDRTIELIKDALR